MPSYAVSRINLKFLWPCQVSRLRHTAVEHDQGTPKPNQGQPVDALLVAFFRC
jgi:hypothetical protein